MAISLDDRMTVHNEIMSAFSLSVQSTYAPIIREQFYQLVPSDFKFYYLHTIRRTLYWYQGYVPEIHKPAAGIFATGIGNSIVKEISKLVTGGQVFFANKYKEVTNTGEKINTNNKTLEKFVEWSDEHIFQDAIKTYIEYASAGGTSAAVTYIDDNRDLVFVPYRIDQFFYRVDFNNRCTDFMLFNGNYTAKVPSGDGRKEELTQFYILEHRYFDDNMKPKRKMEIHAQYGNMSTGETFDISKTSLMNWEQMPKRIQKELKRDFPDVTFGKEQDILYTDDLGVYILKWTTTNRVPSVKMGESVLLNVIGYLVQYEQAESEFVTDMYLARGRVLLPEELRNPSQEYGGYYSGFDSMIYSKMPLANPSEQKPEIIQFEMRAEEWAKSRNNISEKIASAIGVSGSDLFSYLRDVSGGSKTATQIAAESQKTVSYIEEKRSIIKNALSKFVLLWKQYYKQKDDLVIRFSSQNMVNKMVTIDEIRMKKEIGMSTFDLFKELYPDYDDQQINEMVERKFYEQEKVAEMNANVNVKAFENATQKTITGKDEPKGITETDETQESDTGKETEETLELKEHK